MRLLWVITTICLMATVLVSATLIDRNQKNIQLHGRSEASKAVLESKWVETEQKIRPLVNSDSATANDKFTLGYALHKQGKISEARYWFLKAEASGFSTDLTQYNIACGFAIQNQTDLAFKHLRQAIQNGFQSKNWMKKDEDLNNLRPLPEFQELLKLIESNAKN